MSEYAYFPGQCLGGLVACGLVILVAVLYMVATDMIARRNKRHE